MYFAGKLVYLIVLPSNQLAIKMSNARELYIIHVLISYLEIQA